MEHSKLAEEFTQNVERTHWHDAALWFVREKRDRLAKGVVEWERLRELASQIKTHTMANLDSYLTKFETNAKRRGIQVHWAKNADEHNRIVLQILNLHRAKKVVKSKSMLTEECGLNPFLEESGIEVVDTDLGERIVQFRKEPPSHIVLPAIHLKKEDVGKTFEKFLNTEEGNSDPTYLTKAARAHLREKFLGADAGITGVNFGICETGGVVVCTNEGNADLGATLPKLHIASMGIEKLIPRVKDLAVFTRLLARSATGQPITSYTSFYQGARDGCELHVVIVDNGRSAMLGSNEFHNALNCIRCGACMNTCPVFRRSGGFSYGATIPGPIGSTLEPFKDLKKHSSLPYACTLCASCSNICPIKINLHEQLYLHRQNVVKAGLMDKKKERALNFAGWIFKHPKIFDLMGKSTRKIMPLLPRKILYSKTNLWGKYKEMPQIPKNSFKELYIKRQKGKK
ncbi:MAG: lactate utilization protein B [Sulfurospirillaceae bacterium]